MVIVTDMYVVVPSDCDFLYGDCDCHVCGCVAVILAVMYVVALQDWS